MTEAQKKVFLDPTDQFYSIAQPLLCGVLMNSAINKLPEEMKSGKGIPFSDLLPESYEAVELIEDGFRRTLLNDWLPNKLPSRLLSRLQSADSQPLLFLDVCCGRGSFSRELAKKYPSHVFVGLDNHKPSIESAREDADREGPLKNVFFLLQNAEEVSTPGTFEGFQTFWNGLFKEKYPIPEGCDVVTFQTTLHDMPDPLALLRTFRKSLSRTGVLLVTVCFQVQ